MTIPAPYYHLFTLLDPLIALWGTSLFLLSPKTVTSSYLPPSHNPIDPSIAHPAAALSISTPSLAASLREYSLPLHAQIAGHLLSNALLSAVLLRSTTDLKVWRVYQLSLFLVDAFLLYGTFASYALQGRLNPFTTWRVEDWGAVAITTLAGVTRLAFLVGLGFPKQQRAKRA
ncbi:hypothetical protein GCG54_00000436 [Colletotrichum gloeosporioides]|uniref:DUF7704 domain-containing protein n=2 Tax=Colletotrichum gloeosporioides TaxID=474922 RepID=T0KZ43_COLGC|nr:uncharacterized protein GCG54_00000436 [Colletotrichum gloeosporioides]EQB57868.1 hypothetical protein CGLO_01944 [Colletotrichum gloeosporioides Cg-14]KAF3810390.1 hypothetical protein GCG54_00000436 [Colletotrichum gloeosporioides]